MVLKKSAVAYALIAATCGAMSCGFPANSAPSKATPASTSIGINASDDAVIRKQIAALADAIAKGDEKVLATLWTPDGLYIDPDGNAVRGREALEKKFAVVFKVKGKQLYELTPVAVRLLSKNVAQADGTVQAKDSPDKLPDTRFILTFVRQNDTWLITTATEIPVTPPVQAATAGLSDLSWLVGNWKAERNGNSAKMAAEWIADRHFIYCKFEVSKANQPTQTDYQIVGWDPIKEQITSWTFLASGGHGMATWFKKDGKWLVDTTAIEPDGIVTKAINTIEPTNPNSFVWQSLNRSIDGITIVDTLPLKVERISQ